jgi:uncharacterized protein YecT (DUF1311 family)
MGFPHALPCSTCLRGPGAVILNWQAPPAEAGSQNWKGHPVLLRPILPRLIGLLPAALFALGCAGIDARAADVAAGDRALLAACLDLVKNNDAARGVHDSNEMTEKKGPAGRLAAARDEAPRTPESCIGVVVTACVQAEGNDYDATMMQCRGREADVWDGRLNAAYKALLAKGDDKDVADGLRKTQRAWIAFRDAACAQPAVAFKGTMAGPISAYCVMDKTARQALWLEGWLQ